MKKGMALALSLALTTGALAAPPQSTPAATTKSTKKKAPSATNAEILRRLEEMQQSIGAQQQQIQQLKDQVQTRDAVLQQLQQQSSQAQAAAGQAGQQADTALSQTTEQQKIVATTHSDVTDLKDNLTNTAQALQETQKSISESPVAIRYKGVSITPGGFVAAETVTRQRANSSDINTPFNSLPYPGNALSKVGESNFTGRQSRVSLLAEGQAGITKLTGYYEADWLGTGVTSNNRQSNSYVLRQRQIWGQAKLDGGWSFTGGQMWTLATEDKKGIDNRQEAIPLTIDPQYTVGFTWARQYGFRVVKNFGDKFALAVSVEGPQATVGGRGFSNVTTINNGAAPSVIVPTGTTTSVTGNTFLDAIGSGGGLFNFADATGYTVNKAPDVIIKAALDPGFGHYEVFGIISTFGNRIYPCGVVGTNAKDTVVPATPTSITCADAAAPTTVSSFGAFNDSRTGGGF